jgi:hypothetical protein
VLTARADVVRSLPPTPELLEAQAAYARGEPRTPDRAGELQDEAVANVLTDGEMRRPPFGSRSPTVVTSSADDDLDAFPLETRLRGAVPRAVGA